MANTMAARTAVGIGASSRAATRTNTRAMSDITALAIWVWPFWSSRISVFVGLPLTTKVPVRPATRFAPPSPSRSRSTSTCWPCRAAKLRDVAADWATMMTKQAKAIDAALGTSPQARPAGMPSGGKPPATSPTTATPCPDATVTAETTPASTTATMAPGIAGRNLRKP